MLDIYDVLGITQIMDWGRRVIGIEKPEYHSEQIKPKVYAFRPKTLDQYIGQARAKELININLEKIRTIKPVHFIISGSKGTGKSTLAYIIANELGFDISKIETKEPAPTKKDQPRPIFTKDVLFPCLKEA